MALDNMLFWGLVSNIPFDIMNVQLLIREHYSFRIEQIINLNLRGVVCVKPGIGKNRGRAKRGPKILVYTYIYIYVYIYMYIYMGLQ